MSKKTLTAIIVIILIALGVSYYWFFVRIPNLAVNSGNGNGSSGNGIFAPFGGSAPTNAGNTQNATTSTTTATLPTAIPVPALREISATPVGGMIASTTASTTILRWIDRGTGHIYQAYGDNTAINEISAMTVPMIYDSYWNTDANAFIFQSLTENSDKVTNFYAQLTALPATVVATTSSASATSSVNVNQSESQGIQYTLNGSPLSAGTLAIAVSPATGKTSANQVFTLVSDGNGGSAGFVSNFDGSKKTQIFDTPLTQLNVQWPTANIIALTTKGTASEPGFLYFVNPTTGTFTKIIGGLNGLSALVNPDGTEVLYSRANQAGNGIITSVYNLTTGTSQNLPFDTLAEKCVWSTLQTTDLYCAIPENIPSASYPDAWYQGTMSFDDSIWEIDTITGDVHELVDLTKTSGQDIDAENLQLDSQEDFLYFINKKDLSLWSFDLNAI